jgi:hypothetical protein
MPNNNSFDFFNRNGETVPFISKESTNNFDFFSKTPELYPYIIIQQVAAAAPPSPPPAYVTGASTIFVNIFGLNRVNSSFNPALYLQGAF